MSGRSQTISREYALLISIALAALFFSVHALASPIQYRFSWLGSGTTTQTLMNIEAQMYFEGLVSNVKSRSNFDAAAPLTGNFTGAGLSGQFSPMEVVIEHGIDTVLRFGPSPVPGSAEFIMRNVPGVDAYDLRSAFGPASTSDVAIVGPISLDFGDEGTLNLLNSSSATFKARTPADDEIIYDFSWYGSGDLVKEFSDLSFEMTFWADIDDVLSHSTSSLSLDAALPLTGNFTGAGLSGQSSPMEVVIERTIDTTVLRFGPFPDPGSYEFIMRNVPGIDLYDLRSAFGPVSTLDVGAAGLFSLDFGDAGAIEFSDISFATFQAVIPQATPAPSTLVLLSIGLAGIGIVRKRMNRAG